MSAVSAMMLDGVSCYVRHSPIEAGRWRLARAAIGWARTYGTMMGRRTIRTRHGFQMRLALNDWVDQHIFATGEYEPDVVNVVTQKLSPGMVAVDIGANIGFFSLLFSSLTGPTGKVIAFEPQPRVRARLQENVRLNRGLTVQVRDEAISDSTGEIEFYCGPPEHSGIASLRPIESSERISVRTLTGDEVLSVEDRVDLIKIDVEGAETRVIAGLYHTIDKFKPHLIVEVSNSYLKQSGSSGRHLTETILKHGYRMFVIRWDRVEECRGWNDSLPDQFNALFTI